MTLYAVIFSLLSSFTLNNEKDTLSVIRMELGVLEHFEWDISYNKGDHKKVIPLMKECGIQWVRQEFRFSNTMITDTLYGEQYLRRCDTLMQLYNDQSLSVLVLFTADSGKNIAEGFQNDHVSNTQSKLFLSFVTNVLKRYKGQAVYFEVLNEPNSAMPPELYAILLKKISKTIKNIDPRSVIVYGGLDIVPNTRMEQMRVVKWGWSEYLRRTHELGCSAYYDVFNFHPFVFPRSPEEGGLKRLIELGANISGKKIWITEFGYPTGEGERRVTEQAQAQYLIDAITISSQTGVVEKFFLANGFRDGIGGPMTSDWSNTGILKNNFSYKPAFYQIQKYLFSKIH